MKTSIPNTSTSKTSKGIVVVESFKDRLRLRWRVSGKRYCLSLGLADKCENRKLAESLARQIELDIISDNFDASLAKYKIEYKREKLVTHTRIGILELFQQYIDIKAKTLEPRTIEKYSALFSRLKEFGDKESEFIGSEYTQGFLEYLKTVSSDKTIYDRLTILSACWDYAWKKRIVESNPWKILKENFIVTPKLPQRPFTKEEVTAIIEGFQTDRYYSYYAPYVQFLFFTGCRTAEAIGLRWKHIDFNQGTIKICESLTRGVIKSIKTNKARIITINPKIREFLESVKPENLDEDSVVFKTPEGNPIDDGNFRNRAWTKVLEKVNVEYRKPYNTRHTFISHCLEAGMNPVLVAQITGHNVQTLYLNYAGVVPSRPTLPELF